MSDTTPVLYEALFLISQTALATDSAGATAHVQEMLDRAEAETLSLNKWDERKLAYPIEGQKRGTYLITLFKVKPTQIVNIERDCNLSEDVLRVMMTRADHMGETELAEALKAADVAADAAKLEASAAEATA